MKVISVQWLTTHYSLHACSDDTWADDTWADHTRADHTWEHHTCLYNGMEWGYWNSKCRLKVSSNDNCGLVGIVGCVETRTIPSLSIISHLHELISPKALTLSGTVGSLV